MFCNDERCKGRYVGSRVIDSRQSADKLSIRRRECTECGKRFTTHERLEEFELIVIKKDGSTQEYDKSKIIPGCLELVKKGQLALTRLKILAFLIEKNLIDSGTREVTTIDIGDSVIRHLYEIDQVAYIDLHQFIDLLMT